MIPTSGKGVTPPTSREKTQKRKSKTIKMEVMLLLNLGSGVMEI